MIGSSGTDADLARAEATFRATWGYNGLREGQRAVVRDVLAGRDVLGVLPTGAGKSVCFQLPALLSDGLTLVVSPLVALMADQVAALHAKGIEATWLGSAVGYGESERRWDDLLAGRYRLLYVAPEGLGTPRFSARCDRLNVERIAVDEAHCVSEWGHDFRPDFLRIRDVAQHMGRPPILAVTATATPRVRRDVIGLLGLQDPVVHVHGFDRPNLVWSVFRGPDKAGRLRDVLDAIPGGGIVYSSTRRGVDAWAERLRENGHPVEAYHAGMSSADRRRAQEAWTTGETRVIVATSAFGMGIDRADVRVVVHADPPPSLEAYYQEAGRAGRDGGAAHAVLLVSDRDRSRRDERLRAEHPEAKLVRQVFELACSMAGIAVGSGTDEPMRVDADRIATLVKQPAYAVRRAAGILERQGFWRRVDAGTGDERDGAWLLSGVRPARPALDAAALRGARRRARARFDDVLAYADAIGCRRRFLLAFFGESAPDHCGRCDDCTGRHEPFVPGADDRERMILMLGLVAEGHGIEEASELDPVPAWRRRAMLDWLASEGLVALGVDSRGQPGITPLGRQRLESAGRGPG